MNIELNKTFEQNYLVKEENSAKHVGSGGLDVLSTPSLVAFMEGAASDFLDTFLSYELSSVGGNISINHLAPTLIGKTITVKGVAKEVIKEKFVTFSIEAFEGDKKIGTADHTRAIINSAKFMERLKD